MKVAILNDFHETFVVDAGPIMNEIYCFWKKILPIWIKCAPTISISLSFRKIFSLEKRIQNNTQYLPHTKGYNFF